MYIQKSPCIYVCICHFVTYASILSNPPPQTKTQVVLPPSLWTSGVLPLLTPQTSTKEPYISAKEPDISAQEPHISARAHGGFTNEPSIDAHSAPAPTPSLHKQLAWLRRNGNGVTPLRLPTPCVTQSYRNGSFFCV